MEKKETHKYLPIKENRKFSFIYMIYIFAISTIVGWAAETFVVYIVAGHFVKRGILYGPFCLIYGFGACILYFLFYNIKATKKNIIYVFITSSIILGTFELVSGLGMKYIFNTEMWNYDGKFLEILNYTTVPILFEWGILGTIYIFFLQPILFKILSFIPERFTKRLAIFIIVFFIVNYIFSVINISTDPNILYKMVNNL
ncbi:MAG: putative ABC transporter permease [Clostridia bacterium]